jgi:hypothetical protein
MAEKTGRFSPAVPRKLCGAFHLQMLITERLSAKMGQSFEQQTVALIGCLKPFL